MSRIHKLETHYQEQLKNHNIDNISEFIQTILNADITKGKYARFLIESFLNDKFLEEDLIGGLDSTIGQTISLFDKHKSKLPVEQRSVYTLDKKTKLPLYQSPGDLWNSVKQFQGELSGKELKKEEQEKIYRETEFVYKDEETGFQIVSPLTKESAKWWGKGTRWCTSADKNNMFYNYAKKSPLLILLIPASAGTAGNGNKLQLWKNKDDIQFMDEADKAVSLKCIEQHWDILEPICLWLNDLRYIPEKYITKEMCDLAVQQNGNALLYVQDKYITKELCELAIRQNGYALQYVPEKLKTKELCELAVKQNDNGLVFFSIPDQWKTKEMCEVAVQQNGYALEYIPDKYITKEMCKKAVRQNGMALNYVPDEHGTEELYKIAVQNNGLALQYISRKHISKELCELAVQQNGWSLEYVPNEYRTQKIYELAVQNNGLTLQCIPEKLRTKKICELAVQKNGCTIYNVPFEYRTPELCLLAVKQNGLALDDVPDKHKTKELYRIAVQNNGYALQYVPEKHKTKELCDIAIRQNINAVNFVPEKHKCYTEIYKLECQQDKKEDSLVKSNDKYQITFQKLKEYFPKKGLSLNIK